MCVAHSCQIEFYRAIGERYNLDSIRLDIALCKGFRSIVSSFPIGQLVLPLQASQHYNLPARK